MSGLKIKTLSGLKKKILFLKRKGKRIVFTNGCFDILHYGHVMYLQKARSYGDILVVGLNSDLSVRKLKGENRPIVGEKDRARVLAALACVDYVVLFQEDTPIKLIRSLKPDVLVKGADWENKYIAGSCEVKESGGRVVTVNLAAGRSTTNIIQKILEKSKS